MKTLVRYVLLFVRDVLHLFMRFEEVSVLAYHSISDANVPTAVSAQAFRAQLRMLQKHGYVFVSLAQIDAWCAGGSLGTRKAVALTFDDGYADFETVALPLLQSFAAPVTLFRVGDNAQSREGLHNDIPLLDEAVYARIAQNPLVTLEFHGRTHADLRTLAGDQLKEEVRSSGMTRYAFAGGNYTPEVLALLPTMGYQSAYSIKPTLVTKESSLYLLPRTVVTSTMSLSDVRFHVTNAARWYRTVRGLFSR